jgi:hypothetical protein
MGAAPSYRSQLESTPGTLELIDAETAPLSVLFDLFHRERPTEQHIFEKGLRRLPTPLLAWLHRRQRLVDGDVNCAFPTHHADVDLCLELGIPPEYQSLNAVSEPWYRRAVIGLCRPKYDAPSWLAVDEFYDEQVRAAWGGAERL